MTARCVCGFCEEPSDCPAARPSGVVKLHVTPRGETPFVVAVVNNAALPCLVDVLRACAHATVTWNDDEERRCA